MPSTLEQPDACAIDKPTAIMVSVQTKYRGKIIDGKDVKHQEAKDFNYCGN